jgi:hypothetical protein
VARTINPDTNLGALHFFLARLVSAAPGYSQLLSMSTRLKGAAHARAGEESSTKPSCLDQMR